MKGTLLILATVLVFGLGAMAAESPIDKGSMMLGGMVFYQTASGDLYENANDETPSLISINPEFAYFVAPSICIGANFEYTKYTFGSADYTNLGIGPTVGYYFNMNPTEVKGAIYPYVKGFFHYNSLEREGFDDKYKTTTIGGNGGINFMITEAVAVDFGVVFSSESEKFGDGDAVKGTVLWFGAGIDCFIW
jgi:hypothetical protein